MTDTNDNKPAVPKAEVRKRWDVREAKHFHEVFVRRGAEKVILAEFKIEQLANMFAQYWDMGWFTTGSSVIACQGVRLTHNNAGQPAVDVLMQNNFYRVHDGEWPAVQRNILPLAIPGSPRVP